MYFFKKSFKNEIFFKKKIPSLYNFEKSRRSRVHPIFSKVKEVNLWGWHTLWTRPRHARAVKGQRAYAPVYSSPGRRVDCQMLGNLFRGKSFLPPKKGPHSGQSPQPSAWSISPSWSPRCLPGKYSLPIPFQNTFTLRWGGRLKNVNIF